jgi:ligand-binding sensor domain-containing protein
MKGQRRSGHILKWLILVPLSFWLGLALPLCAQEQTIAQMVHTSWTARDGAPLGITALAQTPDGTLWIASFGGLFSFDGVKFEAFRPKRGSDPLPTVTIRLLFLSKTGDLWAFPYHGPPVRIHQGEVRDYDRVEDEHIDVLDNPQEDSSGTFWAVLNWKHLVRLGSDGAWHKVADPTNDTHISRLFIDSSDTQWVVDSNVLYRRSKGETGFTATGIHVYGPAKIAESRDHTLWVSGKGPAPAGAVNLQHIDPVGHSLFAQRVGGALSDILVAPDDSLWVSKINAGLQRLRVRDLAPGSSERSGEPPDLYALKSGIADLGAQTFLRDADGNIWVGGMGGLDRFEHANLVPAIVDSKVGICFTCVDTQGNVWIADADGKLFTVKNGRATLVLGGGGSANLFCGAEGGCTT